MVIYLSNTYEWYLNYLGDSRCPKEIGYCVQENGQDQNTGVIKKSSLNGNTIDAQEQCLELCKQTVDATGCEMIWDQHNSGCYVHTREIAKGNGLDKHFCWVFSNCGN